MILFIFLFAIPFAMFELLDIGWVIAQGLMEALNGRGD